MHDDGPRTGAWQPHLPLRTETAGASRVPAAAATPPAPTASAAPVRPTVEVVRSASRRRTSSASVRDGRVVVRVPAHLTAVEVDRAVDDLMGRLRQRAERPAPVTSLPPRVPARPTRTRRGARGDAELAARADRVAARWLGPEGVRADTVVWSHRMATRWASVTVPPGRIRVSHRLADAPDAVLDNTLLHELAHLVHRGHGARFRALVARDPASADVAAWLAARSRAELRTALGLG